MARPLLYGEGSAITLIAPFIALLLDLLKLNQTLFLSLFLFGMWTVAYAFAFADNGQRFYYLSWGLIVTVISSVFMTSLNYSAALILIAVIALILYSASQRWGRQSDKVKSSEQAMSNNRTAAQ